MDGHGRSTTAAAADLRLRLYRPEPPAGAVPAYLECLRTLPPPARSSVRRAHRGAAPGAALSAAVLVAGLVAAVVVGRQVPVLAQAERAPAVAAAATSTAPPVPGIPLGGFAGTGASARGFTARDHRVAVGVVCSGGGTVTLRMAAEQPTVFTCDKGTDGFGMVSSTGPLDRFTISVTAEGPARWSVAAGALTTS